MSDATMMSKDGEGSRQPQCQGQPAPEAVGFPTPQVVTGETGPISVEVRSTVTSGRMAPSMSSTPMLRSSLAPALSSSPMLCSAGVSDPCAGSRRHQDELGAAFSGALVDTRDGVELNSSSDESFIGQSGVVDYDDSSDEDRFFDEASTSARSSSRYDLSLNADGSFEDPADVSSPASCRVERGDAVKLSLCGRDPSSCDALMDPGVQKAAKARRPRRKRMSILKVRFQPDHRNSEEPENHCADDREARKHALQEMAENIRLEGVRRVQLQRAVSSARRAFESFHRLSPGSSSEAQVSRSSAGIAGWSKFADFLEHEANAVDHGPLQGLLCDDPQLAKFVAELEGSEEVASLIAGPTRRCPSAIDGIVSGSGGGLGRVNLCEGEVGEEINVASEWQDIEFEVCLDSGCTDNVCHPGDVPGYVVEPSMGSRAKRGFTVGNGARVTNDGQAILSLQRDGALDTVSSTFQIAKVSRPLMSVGRLCDAGLDVIFKKDRADVIGPEGAVVLSFERAAGGLYIAKLKLKRPPSTPFGRQG